MALPLLRKHLKDEQDCILLGFLPPLQGQKGHYCAFGKCLPRTLQHENPFMHCIITMDETQAW
jgi:hypothetical protein